jgi:hypothetical protein
MHAHGRDTWADAARIVLEAICADPANPVNRHDFTEADLPRLPRLSGQRHRALVSVFASTICLYLPRKIRSHVEHLTRGTGWTVAQATGAVLEVARRLDDGAAYRPGARP